MAPAARTGQGLSASASIRIQVIVEPRIQVRSADPGQLTLSSNRGRILIACDAPGGCPGASVGGRGVTAAAIARPAGGYTVAQP